VGVLLAQDAADHRQNSVRGAKPKPFGLSLSKAFSSLRKKGKRFDRLTANGTL